MYDEHMKQCSGYLVIDYTPQYLLKLKYVLIFFLGN